MLSEGTSVVRIKEFGLLIRWCASKDQRNADAVFLVQVSYCYRSVPVRRQRANHVNNCCMKHDPYSRQTIRWRQLITSSMKIRALRGGWSRCRLSVVASPLFSVSYSQAYMYVMKVLFSTYRVKLHHWLETRARPTASLSQKTSDDFTSRIAYNSEYSINQTVVPSLLLPGAYYKSIFTVRPATLLRVSCENLLKRLQAWSFSDTRCA